MKLQLDRLSVFGLFITAIVSPCCFPLFGVLLSAMGLGSFEMFGGWTMWVFQAFVLISIAGLIPAYLKHRCMYPLIIAVTSAGLILTGYHFIDSEWWIYLVYTGMFGLLAASVTNFYKIKMHNTQEVELHSQLTCPSCGNTTIEEMPTDACQYFFHCQNCDSRIKPLAGDCCVFCSYGTVKCPPIQKGVSCC